MDGMQTIGNADTRVRQLGWSEGIGFSQHGDAWVATAVDTAQPVRTFPWFAAETKEAAVVGLVRHLESIPL